MIQQQQRKKCWEIKLVSERRTASGGESNNPKKTGNDCMKEMRENVSRFVAASHPLVVHPIALSPTRRSTGSEKQNKNPNQSPNIARVRGRKWEKH